MQTTTTPKRTQNLILFLGIIVFFSTVSLFVANTAFMVTNEVYHGVVVGDIPVGGLTQEEAEAKLTSAFDAKIKKPILFLEYKDTKRPILASDINLSIDAKSLTAQAYNIGRNGNIFNQIKERYLTVNRGHTIPLALSYNATKLNTILSDLARKVDREPKNATLSFDSSNIQILPETIGLKVEIAKALAETTALININLGATLSLPVMEIAPSIRTSDLEEIDTLISSYSTQFDSSDKNRSENIYLAAKSIHSTLVKAGQEFSFNTNVGPRLAQNGYKEAPVFIEGKLVPDFGGGVCQVSSTLYNAVLLADMSIIERTPHFRPPGYVPLGQDATVADNLLDFRFKNTNASNIYITSEIVGNQLSVLVFGKRNANPLEIRITSGENKVLEPNTVVKQDPALELGKQIIEAEGQKGFYVTTYRVKYTNGKEIKRELLAADEFKAVDHIIRVGTKIPSPTK